MSFPQALYLDLMKGVLTRTLSDSSFRIIPAGKGLRHLPRRAVQTLLATRGLQLVMMPRPQARHDGRDWPTDAETMIGRVRLDNLQEIVTSVLLDGVAGDLIETGVWRGGATIFMRAVLEAYGDKDRVVWAADSFQGLPRPDSGRYQQDAGDKFWGYDSLAVSLDDVKAAFARYNLLDNQVKFLPGWFSDTLPDAPIERLSVLRLDGDMYESTIVALESLYPKLSVGGYVIIDDYGAVPACKSATDDYRAKHSIIDEIQVIDWTGVFWRRSA